MRINPQGVYTRAIEDYDYVVPRSGYFFEVRTCCKLCFASHRHFCAARALKRRTACSLARSVTPACEQMTEDVQAFEAASDNPVCSVSSTTTET